MVANIEYEDFDQKMKNNINQKFKKKKEKKRLRLSHLAEGGGGGGREGGMETLENCQVVG